jgi:hypothetical protein
MQHIKDYMRKIDAQVASRTTPSRTKKGLLGSTKPMTSNEEKTELSVIASFVASIRAAREEMKNAK